MPVRLFLEEQRTVQSAAITNIGDRASLVDDLIGLYKNFGFRVAALQEIHPLFTAFPMSIQSDIAAACSLALGGRPDAALAVGRRALEIAGFARVIAEDSDAASIWIFANYGKESWAKYKNSFELKKLFPRGEDFWRKVYERYDALSGVQHPGPGSFSRLEFAPTGDGTLRIATRRLEHSPDNPTSAVEVTWEVLGVFAVALSALKKSVYEKVAREPSYDLHVRIRGISRKLQI